MNILLYVNSFLPKIGGREMVVYYLAKSLTELGHKARVVGPSGFLACQKLKFKFPVHCYPRFIKGDLKNNDLFSHLREKEITLHLKLDKSLWGCDVIHAHNTFPSGYIATRAEKTKIKIPLIITPHGMDINVMPEIKFGMRLQPYLIPKIDQALSSCDAVTAISDGIENSILDAGVDSSKLFKIPNGVDIERFARPVDADIYKYLQINDNSKIILTVGNYHPRKGQEYLIKAMPKILEVEPSAKLVIVGANTEKLFSLIHSLQLEDSVRLTGTIKMPILEQVNKPPGQPIQADMLAAIYNSSELYVSASTLEGAEGLSLALLDAMAAGLPVIGTRITGNKDVITDGHNGYKVAPSDINDLVEKIVPVLQDNALRVKMGQNAKVFVTDYHWQNIARQYLSVYEGVLAQHNK